MKARKVRFKRARQELAEAKVNMQEIGWKTILLYFLAMFGILCLFILPILLFVLFVR